jgi:hypothetical protein
MRKIDHLPAKSGRAITLSIIVLAGLFIFAVVGTGTLTNDKFAVAQKASAASETSGEWTAEAISGKPGLIQLTFISHSDNGNYNNMMGHTFTVNDLQGLNPSAISAAADTVVNFSLVREPGTIDCRGSFAQGKGAGFWKFSPNASFVSAMKSRGYANLTDDDLLRAAFHSLTTKYVDELKAAGYGNLTFEQLSRGAGHDVTVAYIREIQNAGYANLPMDELIRAKNHEIDGEYIKEIRALGFEKESLEDVIRMKNHEISRQFIDEMKSAGFESLSLDELIRLRNHEVTVAFVNDLKAEGFSNLTADNVIRARTHDINRDVIQKAKAQGYSNISLEELIRLQSRGVIK